MSDDEQEQYLTALALCYGAMDPCDWAAMLSTKLLRCSQSLRNARDIYEDQSKDITQFTETDSLSEIRIQAAGYLSQVYEMLSAMPMIQSQPQILDSLRFIVTAIADIDRGNRAAWLEPVPTKKHPKRLMLEAEWVPIIAALELLLFDPKFPGVDSAAKEIARRTARKVGTIKGWYQKLRRKGKTNRPAAWEQIEQEVAQIRAVLNMAARSERAALIESRVAQLLK